MVAAAVAAAVVVAAVTDVVVVAVVLRIVRTIRGRFRRRRPQYSEATAGWEMPLPSIELFLQLRHQNGNQSQRRSATRKGRKRFTKSRYLGRCA